MASPSSLNCPDGSISLATKVLLCCPLDSRVQGQVPAWGLGVSAYHGQVRFARATHRGCAEGQSPFAECLGVSPTFLIFPQDWGAGG